MKRWLKIISPIFVFAFFLLLPGIQAQAGTIATVTASAGNGQITVSGTADDDVLAVAIFVYDSTETTLLKMKSVAVDSSHAYSDTIAVENGTYVVKVADYEGGDFNTTTVTVGTTNPNPDGGSNISSGSQGSSSNTVVSEEQVSVAVEYIVVKGDTLNRIARRNNMSLSELLALNPQIKNPNRIYPGQRIIVGYTGKTMTSQNTETVNADAEYYIVQRGDYLYKIARKNGLTMAQLAELNPKIVKQKYIYQGQKVRVK